MASILGLPFGCERPFDVSKLENPSSCAQTGPKACEAACARDDGSGCLAASVAHKKKRETMMKYELRACELGTPQACHYYANNFKGSDGNPATAREYSDRSCRLGWAEACGWLATSYLAPPPDDRLGVQNLPSARAAWEAGCAADASYCGGLGDFEALGLGGERDVEQARAHWKAACGEKNEAACLNLRETDARVWLDPRNLSLISAVKIERLNLELQGALPGQKFNLVAGVCFQKGGTYDPVHTEVIEPSGTPALDAAVIQNLAAWRARPKSVFPDDRAACIPLPHKIKTDGRINAQFGSGSTSAW